MSVQDVSQALNGAGYDSFNTSYVSVQEHLNICGHKRLQSFNTSYLSVQGIDIVDSRLILSAFQYILCVGSRQSFVYFKNTTGVSIHPMCRFKVGYLNSITRRKIVSIHPMCRFKQSG